MANDITNDINRPTNRLTDYVRKRLEVKAGQAAKLRRQLDAIVRDVADQVGETLSGDGSGHSRDFVYQGHSVALLERRLAIESPAVAGGKLNANGCLLYCLYHGLADWLDGPAREVRIRAIRYPVHCDPQTGLPRISAHLHHALIAEIRRHQENTQPAAATTNAAG